MGESLDRTSSTPTTATAAADAKMLNLKRISLLALSLWALGGSSTPVAPELPELVAAKRLINTTIFSTNPRISYHPESQCAGGPLGSCGERYDPWKSVSYTSSGGIVETFFETSNWQNQPDTTQIRRVSFGFRGSAIYLYGAPFDRITYSPGAHDICLGLICHTIDVSTLYQRSVTQKANDKPVLLWSQEGLDVSRYHEVHLRFRHPHTSENYHGITFHHLIVTEEAPEQREPWRLNSDQEFVETTYFDTNPLFSYSPLNQRDWEKGIVSIDGLRNQSFHHTTSDGNQPDSDQIRAVSWSFKGAQLTVYGAPKSLLLHPSGHAEICVEMKCQAIDMTRIYNNIWSTNDRVLLYSNDRFDPTKTTFATIHFLEKESPISGVVKGFALSQIVVTEVRPRNMVESGTRLIKHTIKDDYPDVEYLPWRSWDVETYPTIFGMSRTFHRTSTWINEVSSRLNRRVEFTIPSRTASCQIYGAPRPRLIHPHGKQEICIYQRFRPDECHPIDVEQAYLTVDPDVINEPVLIHSFDGLDVRYTSKIQLKLADRTETGDRNVRGMTFSELVCWEYQDGRGPYWEWNPGHGSPGEMTSTVESVPRYTPTNPGPTVPQGTPTSTKTAGRPLPTSTHPHEDPPSPGPPDLSLWFAVLYLLGLALWIRYRRLTITQNCPPEQQPILPTSSSSRSSRSGPQSSSHPSYTNSTATAQPVPGRHPEQVARPLGMEQVLGLSFSMINDLPLEVLAVTVESVTGAVYTVPPAEPGYWARSRRYILKLKLMKCLWDWRFAYEVGRRIDEQERERIAQLHRDRMADEQRRVQERQERERMQPSGECVICYDARATVLILDCGHLCLCSGCATRVQQQGSRCPMCRGQVRRIVSTYSP